MSDGTRSFVPAADLVVGDDEVIVNMDLPGMTADDVTIEARENAVTVSGERPYPYADDDDRHRIERGYGKFERVLQLPFEFDADAIKASMDNGVLTLRIPKPQPLRKRRIEISSGEHADTIEAKAEELAVAA